MHLGSVTSHSSMYMLSPKTAPMTIWHHGQQHT